MTSIKVSMVWRSSVFWQRRLRFSRSFIEFAKPLDPLAQISHVASVVSIEDLKSSSLQLDRAPDEIQGLAQSF